MYRPPAVSELSDQDKAELAHATFVEYHREQTRWAGTGGVIEEREGVLLHASTCDFPVGPNGMFRLDPAVPADDAVALAAAWFADRKRGWSIAVGDFDGRDAGLPDAAEAHGLFRIMDAPTLICDARVPDAPVPAGIEVREATDERGIADLVAIDDVAYRSLGMPAGVVAATLADHRRVLAPHVHTYVVYEDDVALACAQITITFGVGLVGWVGTVEAARGRGLAELVTRTVTNRGFDLGAAFVSLQASTMGDPIYRRMGYRELYRYTTYTHFVGPI